MSKINTQHVYKLKKFIEKNFPNGAQPKEIVRAATPKSSPIHDLFEWDDSIAGAKYRLVQARRYIAHITIEDVPYNGLREYYSVKIDDEKKYMHINQIKNVPSLMSQVIEKALQEAEAWQRKYKQYRELSSISSAITKTKRKLLNGKESKG